MCSYLIDQQPSRAAAAPQLADQQPTETIDRDRDRDRNQVPTRRPPRPQDRLPAPLTALLRPPRPSRCKTGYDQLRLPRPSGQSAGARPQDPCSPPVRHPADRALPPACLPDLRPIGSVPGRLKRRRANFLGAYRPTRRQHRPPPAGEAVTPCMLWSMVLMLLLVLSAGCVQGAPLSGVVPAPLACLPTQAGQLASPGCAPKPTTETTGPKPLIPPYAPRPGPPACGLLDTLQCTCWRGWVCMDCVLAKLTRGSQPSEHLPPYMKL